MNNISEIASACMGNYKRLANLLEDDSDEIALGIGDEILKDYIEIVDAEKSIVKKSMDSMAELILSEKLKTL